ncbi:hypothetical protein RRG08_003822 [Elysia crispata]|uniref:Uncharacterized protein n=1 Tax=Elysia crispata TaxID=231223 RepID=A0AAE0ZE66_9GAST|nr:hypothetical protein RRG08_003822 [Elysia crispata]
MSKELRRALQQNSGASFVTLDRIDINPSSPWLNLLLTHPASILVDVGVGPQPQIHIDSNVTSAACEELGRAWEDKLS